MFYTEVQLRVFAATALLGVLLASPAAAESSLSAEIDALRQQLLTQQRLIEAQAQQLEHQRLQLEEQRGRLDTIALESVRARGISAAPAPAVQPSPQADAWPSPRPEVAQAGPPLDEGASSQDDTPERPREGDLTLIRDRGGVLTPKGGFIIEPEIQFSTSSSNRFFFQGVEIVEAVLFGIIEANETDRETFTGALGARYGVTDRFEVDVRVPYLYRNDRIESTGVNDPSFNQVRDIDGDGLGDVEFGAHYQINDGREGWPLFIANLNVKSDTGTGPFDVDRNAQGLETELATGSGFWSIEPSVTAILPTDPAVLFLNVGYSFNLARDVNERIPNPSDEVDGFTLIEEVDPGDSINVSFGVGIGLNDRFSISLGYEHNYVLSTDTEIEGVTAESDDFHVASLLLGGNYRITDNASIDLRISAGLTEEAPDARVTLRVPIAF